MKLETGWPSINTYVLGGQGFVEGSAWIIRSGNYGGKTTFSLGAGLSAALTSNGMEDIHIGIAPTLLIITADLTENEIINKLYHDVSSYCDLVQGSLTDPAEQLAYVKFKLSINGFHLAIRKVLNNFSGADYAAIIDELNATGNRVRITIIDGLLHTGDVTAAITPLIEASPLSVNLISLPVGATMTHANLAGYADTAFIPNKNEMNLLTTVNGQSMHSALKLEPFFTSSWIRHEDNKALTKQ